MFARIVPWLKSKFVEHFVSIVSAQNHELVAMSMKSSPKTGFPGIKKKKVTQVNLFCVKLELVFLKTRDKHCDVI